MQIPESIAEAVQPLFDALPLTKAMGILVPKSGASPANRALVAAILKDDPIASRPALQSALWLYVDELDRSHEISQAIGDATGAYWHGIMHRREGDFSNAHYWFRRAGMHPAMAGLPGYDGHSLVDDAGAAYPENPPELVQRQRDEWENLFAWCANKPK